MSSVYRHHPRSATYRTVVHPFDGHEVTLRAPFAQVALRFLGLMTLPILTTIAIFVSRGLFDAVVGGGGLMAAIALIGLVHYEHPPTILARVEGPWLVIIRDDATSRVLTKNLEVRKWQGFHTLDAQQNVRVNLELYPDDATQQFLDLVQALTRYGSTSNT